MSKFFNLFVVALVALMGSASAFTTVQPKTSFSRPAAVVPVTPQVAQTYPGSSTSLNIVDPAIVEMVNKSDPVGAIAMLVLVVTAWELATPGRAKKN